MICPACGSNVSDLSQFCPSCGKPVSPQQSGPLTGRPFPSATAQTSGKAIGSLVCGIINIFPLFIVAIVLGHISLSEIKRSAGQLKGEGMAVAGLVLGYLGVAAIPILLLAAIAIPNLLRAKIAANESSAAASVREIVNAEVAHQTAHPETGFTCNFSDLSNQLDSRLRSGFKSGYTFFLRNCTAETDGAPVSKFQITAIPTVRNSSGVRAFCADETGVIKLDRRGSEQDCLDHGSPLE